MTPAEAATKAMQLSDGLSRHLLIVTNREATPEHRLDAATRAWSAWPKLQRAMSDLSKLTPNSTEAGYDDDADLVEAIERAQREGVPT